MRFFIDCEFNEGELRQIPFFPTIELISIGVVSENGDEFYREANFNPENSNQWVRENVWPFLAAEPVQIDPHRLHSPLSFPDDDDPKSRLKWALPHGSPSPEEIGEEMIAFIEGCLDHAPEAGASDRPVFWGYYADYDWVRLCWCFGKMVDLPSRWPMYCRDLKQVLDSIGNPEIPAHVRQMANHNALADAHFTKALWEWLHDAINDAGEGEYFGIDPDLHARRLMLEA